MNVVEVGSNGGDVSVKERTISIQSSGKGAERSFVVFFSEVIEYQYLSEC